MNRIAFALLATILVTVLVTMLTQLAPSGGELVPGESLLGIQGSLSSKGARPPGGAVDSNDRVSDAAAQGRRRALSDSAVEVFGQLVDEQGSGLGGVRAVLRSGTQPEVKRETEWAGPEEWPTGRTIKTSRDGFFRLAIPRGSAGWLQLSSDQLIWSRGTPAYQASLENVNLGRISIRRAAVLSGRVLTEAGAPIPQVLLTVHAYEFDSVVRRSWTDRHGEFRLGSLPGGAINLSIFCVGYVNRTQSLTMTWGESKVGLEIRLRKGLILRGTVLDDRSNPVAGAILLVSTKGRRLPGGEAESGWVSATADDTGSFEVSGLGAPPFSLVASAPGHDEGKIEQISTPGDGIQVRINRTGTCCGRLVDEAGSPIAGSLVRSFVAPPKMITAGRPDPLRVRRTRNGYLQIPDEVTDIDGRFTLSEVVAGKVWLRFRGAHRRAVFGPIGISPGEVAKDIRIVATRGARVSVEVTGPTGKAVANALVSVAKPGAAMPVDRSSLVDLLNPEMMVDPSRTLPEPVAGGAIARTGRSGDCELGGLTAGVYELQVSHESWISPTPIGVEVSSDEKEKVTVRMEAGGYLALRITDSTGAPVAQQGFRVRSSTRTRTRSESTDAAGRASIGPLAAGAYAVALETKPIGPRSTPGREIGEPVAFTVVANESVEVVMVRQDLASLRGTVGTGTGPVANARVTLTAMQKKGDRFQRVPSASSMLGRTNSLGAFHFEDLSAGAFKLSVTPRRGALSHDSIVRILGSAEHREDVYLKGGTVKVRVLVDDEVVAKVPVRLFPAGSPPFSILGVNRMMEARTNADGWLEYRGVPPGSYVLRCGNREFLPPSEIAFRVQVDDTVRRELKLKLGGSLHYSCESMAEVKRVGRVCLEITPQNGKPRLLKSHGATGKFSQLRPGRYELRMRHASSDPNQWSARQTIEILPGKPALVRFVLP